MGVQAHLRKAVIKVRFYGPYSICSDSEDVLANCEYATESGLYVWAVPQLGGSYVASCIGQTTTSFYRRTKEHIIQTMGGNYRILDPDLMMRGIENIVWDGLWRRGTRNRLPEFLADYEHLAPVIKRYLLGQVMFVATLQLEGRTLKRIEGALAQCLMSNLRGGVLLPRDIRYLRRRSHEQEIEVTFPGDLGIEGFPKALSV